MIGIVFAASAVVDYRETIETAEKSSISEAENIAKTTVFFIASDLKEHGRSHLLEHLSEYVLELQAIMKRDIAMVDVNKRILADAVEKNIGSIFEHDADNEVGRTIQDGKMRMFIEWSWDYPAGIRQLVVPVREVGTETIIGALILEYTPLYNAALQRARDELASTFGVTLLGIMLAGGMGWATYAGMNRQLKRLRESATNISIGNYDVEIEVTKDELGEFASVFNKMAAALKKSQKELLKHSVELEEAQSALEKSNNELQNFAYVVSHDLKAPLRAISSLSSWLAADYADKLDEEGRESLTLLGQRAKRMNALIDGILDYSRVGRIKEEITLVDLNSVVSEVIDSLSPPENVSVAIETTLPTMKIEQTRIFQLFQNLLSNAVKHLDKPTGEIRIGCVDEGQFYSFYVADNGPGIDEQYFDRIFQLFQTLKPRDEVENTGVGLTIVKKIVEMYGGRIWVESKVGEGTIFRFTLPNTWTLSEVP